MCCTTPTQIHNCRHITPGSSCQVCADAGNDQSICATSTSDDTGIYGSCKLNSCLHSPKYAVSYDKSSDVVVCATVTTPTVVAQVAGTTAADEAFWTGKCNALGNPWLSEDDIIKVEMGQVTDYFKPTTTPMRLCSLLTSHTKHKWSATHDGIYVTPNYGSDHFGGSASGWPSDGRAYLSSWGDPTWRLGGCCHTSYTDAEDWGRSFAMTLITVICIADADAAVVGEGSVYTHSPTSSCSACVGEYVVRFLISFPLIND